MARQPAFQGHETDDVDRQAERERERALAFNHVTPLLARRYLIQCSRRYKAQC
jgi:hypothetical protein